MRPVRRAQDRRVGGRLEEQDRLAVRRLQQGHQPAYASLRRLAGHSWASASEAAKVEFFKRCKAEGQHLSFDRARSLLVDTLTSTVTESNKTSVGGGFQPLSWWAQHRYDVEAVLSIMWASSTRARTRSRKPSTRNCFPLSGRSRSVPPSRKTCSSSWGSRASLPAEAAAPKAPESTAAKNAEVEERSGADYSLDLDKELEALLEVELEDMDLSEDEPCAGNGK